MKVTSTTTKRTFTLENISEEEMFMLRYFARKALDPAANRFLAITEEVGSYNPSACFIEDK